MIEERGVSLPNQQHDDQVERALRLLSAVHGIDYFSTLLLFYNDSHPNARNIL